MTIKTVQIIFSSNGEGVLSKLAKKSSSLDKETSKLAVNTKQYAKGATDVQQATRLQKMQYGRLGRALRSSTALKLKDAFATKVMNRANKTAGLNIGMLSLRLNEGLIPLLLTSYTAMLPVIAGLLAIGSAAAVAVGGLAGVLGVGLWAWSQQGKNSDIWGSTSGLSDDTDIMDQAMKGLRDALKAPEIKDSITWAVDITKDIFANTLPDAFKNFIQAVDGKAIKNIVSLFQSWLPKAATTIGEFGENLYNLIGRRSLTSINKFFKYIAGGLESTANWLSDSGFTDLEFFASTIGKIIGKLNELGKSVLPILTSALDSVYPNPIEPVIDIMVRFFNAIRGTGVQKGLNQLAQIGVYSVMLGGIALVLGGIISLLRKVIFIGIIGGVLWVVRHITSSIYRVYKIFERFFTSLIDMIHGRTPTYTGKELLAPLISSSKDDYIEYGSFWTDAPDIYDAYDWLKDVDNGISTVSTGVNYIKGDVYMDSEKVGEITEPTVSNIQIGKTNAATRLNSVWGGV